MTEGWGGTAALAVTFHCLFCRMEQEVRKVAIWWVFISRWLPRWLNVSWRWSCRQLRGRAVPGAQGGPPGCSSSPLKEGQQSNESRSAPNLQLVLCQLYCVSPTVLSVQLESNPPMAALQKHFSPDWAIPGHQSLWNLINQDQARLPTSHPLANLANLRVFTKTFPRYLLANQQVHPKGKC